MKDGFLNLIPFSLLYLLFWAYVNGFSLRDEKSWFYHKFQYTPQADLSSILKVSKFEPKVWTRGSRDDTQN